MSETEAFSKKRDSFIAGISVRGTVALLVAVTTCAATMLKIEVPGSMQTIVVLVVGYYFGRTESKS